MKYEINILMGLPGSGKSYFANHSQYEKPRDIFTEYLYYVDLDKYMCKGDTLEDTLVFAFNEVLTEKIWSYPITKRIIFVDGLILTFDDLNKVIDTCFNYFNVDKHNDSIIFNIHHWNEDRETCLNNDNIRIKLGNRDKSSSITIKHAKFDNIEHYHRIHTADTPVLYNIIKHNVFKLDEFQYILNEYANEYNKMVSETWSGGGEWCNCWGDSGIIEEESAPEFTQFDELIQIICPNITYVQYKQVYGKCVDINEEDEFGYYGGYEKKYKYVCDLKKMYDCLKEMNVI